MFKNNSKEILQLKERIKELEEILDAKTSVSFLLDEAIPKGETDRKKYMADCAMFYAMIFKDKLKHFIGLQMEELSKFGRSREAEDFFRANINCFRLIDEWMDKNTKEHFGNLEELRNNFEDNDEFISKFKETYEI